MHIRGSSGGSIRALLRLDPSDSLERAEGATVERRYWRDCIQFEEWFKEGHEGNWWRLNGPSVDISNGIKWLTAGSQDMALFNSSL
jgi:hypothetical protein